MWIEPISQLNLTLCRIGEEWNTLIWGEAIASNNTIRLSTSDLELEGSQVLTVFVVESIVVQDPGASMNASIKIGDVASGDDLGSMGRTTFWPSSCL